MVTGLLNDLRLELRLKCHRLVVRKIKRSEKQLGTPDTLLSTNSSQCTISQGIVATRHSTYLVIYIFQSVYYITKHGGNLCFINLNTSGNIYGNSFFPRSIREWNALPYDKPLIKAGVHPNAIFPPLNMALICLMEISRSPFKESKHSIIIIMNLCNVFFFCKLLIFGYAWEKIVFSKDL